MNDSTLGYNLSMDDKFSQKTISENPNYKHVCDIINYHKDRRVLSIKDKSISDEFIEGNEFEIPTIDTSIKLGNLNYSRAYYVWICYVISIQKQTFTARVQEVRSTNKKFEEAEFAINDLDDEEIKMLKIGSVFYWSVGYEYRNGTKKNESFIRFKRLPMFNQKQIDDALDLSIDLFNGLNWVD